jgi:uncharacterized protein (DUF169 family)
MSVSARSEEEVRMKPLNQDLSIFRKFDFEKPPVGVSFVYAHPKEFDKLDKTVALCEMIREAQESQKPFYATKENETCFGKVVMGMEEAPPFAESGRIGVELEIFQNERANSRIYQHIYKLSKNTVNYVLFSSLDQLTFEPDLLFLLANTEQAEIVLRAMSYSTGEMWTTKGMSVLSCSWLFAYPYKSGNVNYTVTGLAFGAKAKQVFPPGRILMSIPYNWIPIIAENLRQMPWVLPSYTDGREKFIEREQAILARLADEK